MQSIVARSAGGPEVLELVEVATPVPGPGQVQVKLLSAGVNVSDVKRRRGDDCPFRTAFPLDPGGEVAGLVEALGEAVAGPAVGARVFALVGGDGSTGYAQHALVEASQTIPVPGDLDTDVAAGLVIAGCTAMLALTEAMDLQPGQRLPVEAADGGVGAYAVQIAVQIAVHLGLEVLVLASTAEKRSRTGPSGTAAPWRTPLACSPASSSPAPTACSLRAPCSARTPSRTGR